MCAVVSFRVAKRDRRSLIFQLVIPIAALALGLFLVTLTSNNFKDLVLTPATAYPTPVQLVYNAEGQAVFGSPFNASSLQYVSGSEVVTFPAPVCVALCSFPLVF